ncbi:Clan CA, family C19, ubiquitin hydrolase-like cysteine peptidase [Tritrichomonas foetus]|uniref:ubiquitinyl hydrolase 1 n=1 Tax=Tritrichomonas foetus TaxID=1144522 RepID=A0A1J4J9C3_9EUKA|nr:Clan CA, family C19, ubiquitin hydrolase-like cysteine peptidase [Tritrichomonas foetus]|eukprot:OHS95273.1 Clan CA, family C19, ubiquitin hydrolase-like cysteine peptidase [Tritrichomonas foetus]
MQNPENQEEHRKKINFIVPKKREVPNGYFNDHWVQIIIKQNPIKQPLAGLTNFGNSCFLNSVLQCLMYCPGLPFFAENIPHIVLERSINKDCFLYHFEKLSREMKSCKTATPSVFFENLTKISAPMKPGYQQDAHEFLFELLNIFDDECQRAWNKNHDYFDTAVHALFGSTLKETRICDSCMNVVSSISRVLDISLPIDKWGKNETPTIEKCLMHFMNPSESVSGFKCEKCNSIGTMSNSYTFENTPYILIITMMRFSATGQKIEMNVDFDFELDISFCSQPSLQTQYELFAVVVHNGHQINFGHFTSAFKIGKVWYSADDTTVTKVSPKSIKLSKPYILFYRRKIVMEPIIVQFGIPENENSQ